jgi:8-oxo-dGTP pyrophosphatase MutT (NUDIX family)
MATELYKPEEITLFYDIPEHLRGIKDTEELREADLGLLERELKRRGSSLDDKKKSKIIWRMGFPGMILDVTKLEADKKSVYLHVSPIHPHRADLAFKRDETLGRNPEPLSVAAMLRERKGYFVLGIRGGNVETGKIAVLPGGHAEYTEPHIETPFDTLKTEFEEELGYPLEAREEEVPILGVFRNRDTDGIHVLYNLKTNLEFREILEKWKNAEHKYEHRSLLTVSQEGIRTIAETGEFPLPELGGPVEYYPTSLFFRDCFRITCGMDYALYED